MIHARLLFAATLLLAGCSPGSYTDLSKPALVVVITEVGAFCTSVYAVDADNRVWASGGCADSIGSLERRDMAVNAALRAELDAQMDEVLMIADDPECDLPAAAGRRYRFLRTIDGTDDPPEVRQCEPAVPLVAVRLAAALEALAAPDTFDAGSDAGDDAAP